jgi:hypothetical protein
MSGSTTFSNISFTDQGRLIINSGSIEGDISIENGSGDTAVELNAGVFYATNCSVVGTGTHTIVQADGELIISNSDIVGDSSDSVIVSNGGTVNISDSRILNAGSGPSIYLSNSANVSNPNILFNIYKKGVIDTTSSVTIVDGIYGDGAGITGSAHVYQPAVRVAYNASGSELNATTVQGALDELANTHSEFQKTHMIYVDEGRTDSYTATGTIDRPFKDIDSAVSAAVPGDTIKAFKGAYSSSSGDIILPNAVNLIGEGQGKTNFYSKVVTGSSGKCRLEHISFRGGLEINNDTFVHYIYSNHPVVFNASVQGDGFSIITDSGIALDVYGGDSTLSLNTISTTADAPAVRMNSGSGVLTLQTSKIINNSSTYPALDSNAGSVILLTASIINNGGGLAADLNNDSTLNNPNMLAQVIHAGGLETDSVPTIVEGVHGGDPLGTAIALRPATQIEYDPSSSGLTSDIVQDALDEITSMLGSGDSVDVVYNNTNSSLSATNVKEALDELDTSKSDTSHSHNSLYYPRSIADTTFVTYTDLSDTTTHSQRAAYQQVLLNGQTQSDPSGLTPDTTYNFDINVDGAGWQTFSITPESATAGYQELGLSGLTTTYDTGLAAGTYDFKIQPNGNGLNTYDIVIDPATPAQAIGNNNLSSGHDWGNYNKDFSIDVNGTAFTVNLTADTGSVADIANMINNVFTSNSVHTDIQAYDAGSGILGIRTLNSGSGQTFTLSAGTEDALVVLGLTPGTYTGEDATAGYEEINLNGGAAGGDNTGLSIATTYDIDIDVDGTAQTVSFEFADATAGYQEFGQSGLTNTTSTGLIAGTTYDVNVEVDGSPENITVNLPEDVNETTQIDTIADSNASLSGTYFWLYSPSTTYYVWYTMQESPAEPASTGYGGNDMSAGYDWSATNQDFSIDGTTVVLTQLTTTISGTVTHINNKITDAGVPGVEAYSNGVDLIGFRTTATGSSASFTISAGTANDALATFAISPGTYTGVDAVNSTDPAPGGTPISVSILKNDDAPTVANKTSTALDAQSDFNTIYNPGDAFLVVNNTSAGDVTNTTDGTTGFTFTTTTEGQTADTTYGQLISQLNASSGSWSLYSGDVRLTSPSTGSTSTVLISNGTSNDLLSALGVTPENNVDGNDADATTFDSLINRLNENTTNATWTLTGGNIRLTSQSLSSTSSIDMIQGSNDFVTLLNGITTPYFINNTSGTDATAAQHTGAIDLSSGFDFRDKSQTLVIDGQTTVLDQNTSTVSDVVGLLNGKLQPGLEAFIDDTVYVGIRTLTTGTTSQFEIESGSAVGVLGFSLAQYNGTNKTDTKISNILSLMNASTTASVTWTLEGGDLRCTYDTPGASSTVDLQPGDTNDLYAALGALTPYDSAVVGTDSTNAFSDIINHLNAASSDVTWSFTGGTIRVTRDNIGSGYSVEIQSAAANDVFSNLAGFVEISSPVAGLDTDTTTGSDLVGVKGISDITPQGKSSGESATLQEILEAGVGQLHTSQPSSPSPGKAWFDTSSNTLWVYNGTGWVGTTLT